MVKKRKQQVFVLKPWCWYCEREFEDEKVLLQHQKSKHFKCQLCPRKLNTAGGLMVHSNQVHKCEPEPLTNTLPGRDTFDIEIFGMEGVPTNALAEWKAKKEQEVGAAALASAAAAKRPRFSYTIIPEADLMAALEQHKAIMANRAAREAQEAAVAAAIGKAEGAAKDGQGVPPPVGMPGAPPAFPPFQPQFAPGFRPPVFPGMPLPTLPVNGAPPFPGTLPPGFRPPLPIPGTAPFPPPGINSPLAARPPPSFVPQTSFSSGTPHFQGTPPAGPAATPPVLGSTPTPAPASAAVQTVVPKDGVFWPDNDVSPAEIRAKSERYRYTSPPPDTTAQGAAATGTGGRKAAADFL
ncbi:hypothetical protein Q5752_000829 [Cryptotrichosporon argae]